MRCSRCSTRTRCFAPAGRASGRTDGGPRVRGPWPSVRSASQVSAVQPVGNGASDGEVMLGYLGVYRVEISGPCDSGADLFARESQQYGARRGGGRCGPCSPWPQRGSLAEEHARAERTDAFAGLVELDLAVHNEVGVAGGVVLAEHDGGSVVPRGRRGCCEVAHGVAGQVGEQGDPREGVVTIVRVPPASWPAFRSTQL